MLKYANKNILKEATGLKTDATVSMYASCDGYYSMTDGIFPMLTAEINIPKASVGHKAIGDKNEIALDALLKGDSNGMITFTLGNFYIKGKGISVSATGKMNDIMGGDPLIDIDADAAFQLDTLGSMMKQNSGMTMHGGISAGIKGSIRASQLNTIGFAQADVSGFIQSGCMSLSSVKDTLDMHLDSLDVWFGATGNTYDKSVEEGERMLAVVASVDSAHIIYKDLVKAAGKDLSLKAQNSASILDRKDSTSVCPFGGRLEIGFISLMGTDTTIIAIAKSDNIFKISPKSGDRKIPLITLKSKSGNVFIRGR